MRESVEVRAQDEREGALSPYGKRGNGDCWEKRLLGGSWYWVDGTVPKTREKKSCFGVWGGVGGGFDREDGEIRGHQRWGGKGVP